MKNLILFLLFSVFALVATADNVVQPDIGTIISQDQASPPAVAKIVLNEARMVFEVNLNVPKSVQKTIDLDLEPPFLLPLPKCNSDNEWLLNNYNYNLSYKPFQLNTKLSLLNKELTFHNGLNKWLTATYATK